jgi:NAD(P)-dependent dehydrogenase (short-subunit alcohol dehydrogenase family)
VTAGVPAVAGLAGQRILVVGASAGIGRCVARQAMEAGAEVVVTARRQDLLDELVLETGRGTAIAADIGDRDQCLELAAGTVRALGGLDLVVLVTGVSLLRRIDETSADDWNEVLATNVVGANLLIQSVVPHVAPDGLVAVFSSEDVTRVRSGLGAYAASKAALEASLGAWRCEFAPLRFTSVAIGATMPTDVSNGFDGELLAEMLECWIRTGHLQNETMDVEHLAASVLGLLAAIRPVPDVGIEHVVLRSPSGALGDPGATRASLQDHLEERA